MNPKTDAVENDINTNGQDVINHVGAAISSLNKVQIVNCIIVVTVHNIINWLNINLL